MRTGVVSWPSELSKGRVSERAEHAVTNGYRRKKNPPLEPAGKHTVAHLY